MPVIQSAGKIETCLHENATGELRIRFVPGEHRGFGQLSPLKCPDCGKEIMLVDKSWIPVPALTFPLIDERPTPEQIIAARARPQQQANAVRPQVAPPAKPTRQEVEQGTYQRLSAQARSLGCEVPVHVLPGLVHLMTTVKEDKSILIVGAGGGILALAADTRGVDHVVVTSDVEVAGLLAPVLKRTSIHSPEWLPEYGRLFDGIVVTQTLTPEWRKALPTLLKPAGDCWLTGQGLEYADELASAWGYQPRKEWDGRGLFFFGDDTPLGDGPGTELNSQLESLKMPHCQTCRALARKMNAWGVSGCNEHFDDIVTDILPRARKWWENSGLREKMRVWWDSNPTLAGSLKSATQIAGDDLDGLLRDAIGTQVRNAIDAAASKGIA